MNATASWGCGVLAVVVLAGAPAAEPAGSKTIRVRNDRQFQAAVSKLANSGGTIRLLPHFYRSLVVPPRSDRRLRIIGRRGVRIQRLAVVRGEEGWLVRG